MLKDFRAAFDFLNKVADLAEEANHHPDIRNSYNVVEFWLSTHEGGKHITNKDQELAKAIDKLYLEKIPATDEKQQNYTKIKLFADGGSRGNPGPSATGYVLFDADDNILKEEGSYLGLTTNNQAEYQAVKQGLEAARSLGAREVDIFLDSLLVVNQMKGIFKVKNRDLWPIYQDIKKQVEHFDSVSFSHVPREMNKLADAEVNKVLDNREE